MIKPEDLAKSGSEHAEQVALFQWAALEVKNYPQLKWLFAIPNGFFASSGQKNKMKAEGLRDGVPDICLPWPKRDHNAEFDNQYFYCGLWLEMKREIYRNRANGGCSEEQLAWHEYLKNVGYQVHVCYGWEDAKNAILEYLK